VAAIPVTALMVDAGSTPVYLEIGERAAHLRELGMSDRAIARALGVTDKTVAKSLRETGVQHLPAGLAGDEDKQRPAE
jgi:hypothetical protein